MVEGAETQAAHLSLWGRLAAVPARFWWMTWGIILTYLTVMASTTGLRGEQFIPCGMMLVACYWSPRTRDFLWRTMPLTFYGMVYDLTHITEPLVRKLYVHVAEPYHFELRHFALHTAQGAITLNQFFATHHWPWLDLLTGTAYLLFLYWGLMFGFVLIWTGQAGERRELANSFALTFFAMNALGFATYYIYPSAPPWYVASFGTGPANFAAQASPAAAIRWDQLTGLHYFQGFYGKSADIFGAIPSLHVAQPLLVTLYGLYLRNRWLTAGSAAYYLLVCFSAIYLQHHYVLDILVGSAYALGVFSGERLIRAFAHRLKESGGSAPKRAPSATSGSLLRLAADPRLASSDSFSATTSDAVRSL